MTGRTLTYALVTPVRTEEANLTRLAESIASQTLLPDRWVIVDNGSEDGTMDVARQLASSHEWVSTISVRGDTNPRPGAPIVRAFHAGLGELDDLPDVVVKLDADTSMTADHFKRLTDAFRMNSTLGIASGTCLEQDGDGNWQPIEVTKGHVRGAVRAYRRECLERVLPLEERVGWDGIDEMKAATLGWSTKMLDDLSFFHHRRLGARDGARTARWVAQGTAAWYMGYRFSYLVLRTVHRAREDWAAIAMLGGYLGAAARREERYADTDVREHLRRGQTLRAVAGRYIEGRRTPA